MGAVMDVVVWLRSLGLGKYEAIFRENDIDETVLPSLTHENLKELGVASFGHRVKLLDAVAALRSDVSGKAPSDDAATTSGAPSGRPALASLRAAASFGRPLRLPLSVHSATSFRLPPLRYRVKASRCAFGPRPLRPCLSVLTRRYEMNLPLAMRFCQFVNNIKRRRLAGEVVP
jgi:hypothetical protein